MSIGTGIVWGNILVVPKGSPYKDLSMEVINYSSSEEAQDKLVALEIYGPVLSKSSLKPP